MGHLDGRVTKAFEGSQQLECLPDISGLTTPTSQMQLLKMKKEMLRT